MLEHLHPKLVHFPIALFLSAGMLSVFYMFIKKESLYQAARYCFNLAALFSVVSLVSGLIEVDRFMLKRFKRPAFFGMVLVCAVLVILTGHLGGQMVYDYGVGVPH